jgi:hypothetical protein
MLPLLCYVPAAVSAFGVRNLFAFCHKKMRMKTTPNVSDFKRKTDTRGSRDLLRHTDEQIWYSNKDSWYIHIFTCRLSAVKRISFQPTFFSYGRKWIYIVAIFVFGAFAAQNSCEMRILSRGMSACLLACNN